MNLVRKWIIIFSIIGFSLYGSIVIWYGKALSIDYSNPSRLVQGSNPRVKTDCSITIKNYLPWTLQYTIKFDYYTGEDRLRARSEDFRFHQFILEDVNQIIDYGYKTESKGWIITYEIPHDYDNFHPSFNVQAYPFTKTVTHVKFSWDYPAYGEYAHFFLKDKPYEPPQIVLILNSYFRHPYPTNTFLPFLIFLFSGLGFALITKENLSDIINSIHSLDKNMVKNAVHCQDLKHNLKILTHCPNLIDDGPAVFLTPATTLLKMILRRKVNRYYHDSMLKSSEGSDSLLAFLESDSTKPGKSLLDFRVIALVVGLLTSVGFSFSWNANAIRPIFIAIGLMILCFNFGYLIFIFRKSPSDIFFVVYLLVITIIVMTFEQFDWELGTVTWLISFYPRGFLFLSAALLGLLIVSRRFRKFPT